MKKTTPTNRVFEPQTSAKTQKDNGQSEEEVILMGVSFRVFRPILGTPIFECRFHGSSTFVELRRSSRDYAVCRAPRKKTIPAKPYARRQAQMPMIRFGAGAASAPMCPVTSQMATMTRDAAAGIRKIFPYSDKRKPGTWRMRSNCKAEPTVTAMTQANCPPQRPKPLA